LLLFVFGVTQAATETLVYIHVAKRLEQLGKHVATHVSMCMFTIALALGAGLGNMVGGVMQQQQWGVQIGGMSAMTGATGLYGAVLSLYMAKVNNLQG
jgi:predicted MFS family arabinose efflux permease